MLNILYNFLYVFGAVLTFASMLLLFVFDTEGQPRNNKRFKWEVLILSLGFVLCLVFGALKN